MAAPVVESSSTYTATSVASIVNTKPTGLAVGDFMVHYCWYIDGTSNSYTTPSGWTSRAQVDSVSAARKFAVFTKVADSSDVAASNFTVNISATCDAVAGVLLRVSGVGAYNTITTQATNPTSATMSFTGSATPTHIDSLILLGLVYRTTDGLTTVGSYTSTPSYTYTEVADIVVNQGSEDPGVAVAYSTASALTEITAYGATISGSKDYHVGSLMLLTPVVNESGTNTLLEVSPAIFSQNGVAGTTGTNDLLEVLPNIPTQSGYSTVPSVWTPTPKS